MKPLHLACCLLVMASPGWAADPEPNATFVCLIQEGRQEAASPPAEKSPPLRGLRCVTSQSGYRCVASGPNGKLEVEPAIWQDQKTVGGNYTVTNGEQQVVTTVNDGILGKSFLLGANDGGDKKPSAYIYMLPCLQREAEPEAVSNQGGKINIRLEIIDGPSRFCAAS